MTAADYEVVGAIDRGAATATPLGGDTILVDNGDDELLIAQPTARSEGDDDE